MMMSMTFEDKRLPHPPSDDLKDIWETWKPEWTGKQNTPQDLQEHHSPTEEVTIHTPNNRHAHKTQRRIVDSRLWESMTAMQQQAALRIAVSHEMMGRGLGYVSSNWERIPGCRGQFNVSEMHAQMIDRYVKWAQQCTKQKLSHSMVLDILCFGFSCRAVDQNRRIRTGSARKNLILALDLFCKT